ncbi:Glutamate-gated chloride channel [Orchesella cincta]|uniref:Glutamate-gated chloride channel n=1 Tax=Orchesella cincta TaxID=48709 RepID=A0A1D2N702_ORCCI|nr:Glutamate-gated chloride channel [Orchesella cincta]
MSPHNTISISLAILLIWCKVSSCNTDINSRIDMDRFVMRAITRFGANEKDLRPPSENATLVTVNAFIRNIVYISEKSHEWKLQLTFRQEWNDARYRYSIESYPSYRYLTLTSTKDIWTPDLFFTSESEAALHEVLQSNVLVRIYPNGNVLYSTRLTVTLSCPGTGSVPGELWCSLGVASYAYPIDDLVVRWRKDNAVQIDKRIVIDDYTVGKVTTGNTEATTIAGKFSDAVAQFHFVRNSCKLFKP